LRQLLGVFGFWRQYISHYAEIVAPLTPLTSKHAMRQWTAVHQEALQKLKAAFLAAPVLRYPDMSREFFVVTDSSDFAVGASLEQATRESQRYPVAFVSHKRNTAESKYPTHERELLAIVLALRTWRSLLLNNDFSVLCQTDVFRRPPTSSTFPRTNKLVCQRSTLATILK
jgi:hypothetical protein